MNYKELYLRIISSIILIILCIFFIFNGSFLFNIFITLCFFVTIYEWQKLSKNKVFTDLKDVESVNEHIEKIVKRLFVELENDEIATLALSALVEKINSK